jgi:hypothetical protein
MSKPKPEECDQCEGTRVVEVESLDGAYMGISKKVPCDKCEPEPEGPPPGSWAATARMMAEGDDSGFDWDAWKDEMKERDF